MEKLTGSPENPGLRFRSTAIHNERRDAAAYFEEKAAAQILRRNGVEQHPSKIREIARAVSLPDISRSIDWEHRWKLGPSKFPHLKGGQHPSKISEVIDEEEEEEEESSLEGDLTHETTEGFGSEQSHEEISEDFSKKDNNNNNRHFSAAKSQNNSEIEELSLAEESSSGISISRGREGEVLLDVSGNSHHVLELDTNTNQQSGPWHFGKMRRVALWRKLGGEAFLKWLFVVLNLVVEVCQATLAQEAAQGKMRHQVYLKVSIATSSFCLVMSLVEAFHEGRSSGVMWQWRGYFGWFYYPDSQRRFGRFSLYFGTICSTVQLLVNLITKLIGEDFVKFDYVPLLLSACYLAARIIALENKTDCLALVNCNIHGRNIAKAKTVGGATTLLYECPRCQEDNP